MGRLSNSQFNAILKYVTAQVTAIGTTGVLTLATNAWTASMAFARAAINYLTASTGGIFVDGLKYSILQIRIFIAQISTLAVQVGLAVLAFDAIGNTLQLLRQIFNAVFNTSFGDDFNKSLEEIKDTTIQLKKEVKSFDLGEFISQFAAGQDRAKGWIDQIATFDVNLLNLLTGGKDAADRFGESGRLITIAQLEAQQQTIRWADKQATLNTVLDTGQGLIERYGLLTLEASDRTRLGAKGIEEFKDKAKDQIKALEAQIATLNKVKTTDKEIQASIQNTINLYQKQKENLNSRIDYLKSEDKETKKVIASLKELSATYDINAEKNKDPEAIANAKVLVDLANQNVDLSKEQVKVVTQSNEIGKQVDSLQRETLNTQQKNVLAANDFNEAMRKSAGTIDLAKTNAEALNKELGKSSELANKAANPLAAGNDRAKLSFEGKLKESMYGISQSFSAENGTYEAARAVNKIIESTQSINKQLVGYLPDSKVLEKQRANLEKIYGIKEGSSILAGADRVGKAISGGIDPLNSLVQPSIPTTKLGNLPNGGGASSQVSSQVSNQTNQYNNITIQDRVDPASDALNMLIKLGRQ